MKKFILFVSLIAATAAQAQQADSAARLTLDSLYARARQLVLEGNGAAGRTLVDSLVNAAQPGTAAHVDALFWRASLAGTASDAERDYRRIIVEYPLSPRSADALLSLAQLEIARGDRENASAHLQRFLLDHPDSPEFSRASVSLGRMLIEQGRMARGCAVIGRARGGVPTEAVELRNQMEYYAQRCDGVDTVEVVVAASPASMPAASTAPTSAPSATRPPTSAPRTDTARPAPTQPRQAATTTPPPAPKPAPQSTATPRDTAKRPAASTAPTRDTAGKKAQPAVGVRYSVQVAAFDTKADADRLVDRLKKRGVAARVFGTAKPFRVRIGRYASESAAADALKNLRAQGISGFVTPAEPEAR